MSPLTLEEAKNRLKRKQPVEVYQDFFYWNEKEAKSIFEENSLASYFPMEEEMVVVCHGSFQKGSFKVLLYEDAEKMEFASMERLVSMMKPLLKGNNRLYIYCCYGNWAFGSHSGIQCIPLAFSDKPITPHRWRCDDLASFLLWEENVLRHFQMDVDFYALD